MDLSGQKAPLPPLRTVRLLPAYPRFLTMNTLNSEAV